MPTMTLAELYVDKLKDLYSAEQQILKALPKMVKAAAHADLQNAFETHRRQTETHVQRLDQIFDELGKSAHGKTCQGMKGIIEEGSEFMKEEKDSAAFDAGLISEAQSVEHYEMAGYGSARTWAEQLGYAEQAQLLEQTLQEERETDELLTNLAEQAANPDAMMGSSEDEGQLADMPHRRSKPRGTAHKPSHRPAEGR